MARTADTQLAAASANAGRDWPMALFFAALPALADITEEPRYMGAVRTLGERGSWRPSARIKGGADLAITQAYLEAYLRERDPNTIAPTLALFDEMKAGSWASGEALFVVPPALAMATTVTGDRKYLERAVQVAPVFGRAREDAWTVAGLARLLEHVPEDNVQRSRLVSAFRHGAEHVRAGDPVSAGCLAYAFAWGVGHGLLDRGRFEPAARDAWSALPSETIDPRVSALRLLAGGELFRLGLFDGSRATTRLATNTLDEPRFFETLELPWAPLEQELGIVPGDPWVVSEDRSGRFLPSQIFDGKLLVSVSLLGRDSRAITVRRLARPFRAPTPRIRSLARLVAHPVDQMMWENDRIVFRTSEQGSSGIDVLVKRVRTPTINQIDQRDASAPLDLYVVGNSRGCGGLGLWVGNKLHAPTTGFRGVRQIASGPVRVAFELDYAPWGPEGVRVAETKRVSLDLGQSLSRIESRFVPEGGVRRLPLAIGLVRHEGEGHLARDMPPRWVSYWEPERGTSGAIGCGLVVEGEDARYLETPEHFMLVVDRPTDRPFVYHAGGCWSQGMDFKGPDDWGLYLAAFARRLSAPVTVGRGAR